MCMKGSQVASYTKWNWDGDSIVHDCVVPSSRPVVGTSGNRHRYSIDVREFLVTERNAVVRRTLKRDVLAFCAKHLLDANILDSREPGTFDLRAALLQGWVSENIRYRRASGFDPWQFPDETLAVKRGDCEDRALLLASLLVGSGVSAYNVRVALGQVRTIGVRKTSVHGHAWVMYKNESGTWVLLEFMERKRGRTGASRALRVEYVPQYVFNSDHLWEVGPPGQKPHFSQVALRRRWSRIDPGFAGDVHRGIVTDALSIQQCPIWVRDYMTCQFHPLLGELVDDRDDFMSHGYDSLDHFDNAYIPEGWQRVRRRLRSFAADPQGCLAEFAAAAHSIADFYAHSSYAHFAPRDGDKLRLFDPTKRYSGLDRPARYDAATGFDLASGDFTTGPSWDGDGAAAADAWNGYLISGRYAQMGDARSAIETLTPRQQYLQEPGKRAALPHHDEIAVDEATMSPGHVLYRHDPAAYAEQFELRRDAAVRHIRDAFVTNWKTEE